MSIRITLRLVAKLVLQLERRLAEVEHSLFATVLTAKDHPSPSGGKHGGRIFSELLKKRKNEAKANVLAGSKSRVAGQISVSGTGGTIAAPQSVHTR